MKRIICIGMANVDVIAVPFDGFASGGDVTYAEHIKITTGGDALNTSLRLASLGLPVSFAGTIGNDAAGDFLLQKIQGMDLRGVRRTDSAQTAVCMALVAPDGQRHFLYNAGSNRLVSGDNVSDDLFDEAALFHAGGIMQMPRLEADLPRLFETAKRRGLLTSMDVTCDLDGLWLRKIEKALPYTDYFLPSIEEVSEITGRREPEAIRRFFAGYGMKGLAVKMGERGCYVTDFRDERYLGKYPTEVVDTTGAGDSFVAGFLAAISQGESCFTAAAVGIVTASVCVANLGATAGEIRYREARDRARAYFNL